MGNHNGLYMYDHIGFAAVALLCLDTAAVCPYRHAVAVFEVTVAERMW